MKERFLVDRVNIEYGAEGILSFYSENVFSEEETKTILQEIKQNQEAKSISKILSLLLNIYTSKKNLEFLKLETIITDRYCWYMYIFFRKTSSDI